MKSGTIIFFAALLFFRYAAGQTSEVSSSKSAETDSVMRLVQLCDPQLGFGEDGLEADIARLEKAVQQINALKPDVVIVAGDMVNDIGDEPSIAIFLQAIARLEAPVLLTAGNHDLPDPVTAEGLQRYRSFFGNDFRTMTCKGRLIVSANSQLWREAPAEERERHDRLLRDALQRAKENGQPVILLTHVPPFISSADEADEYFNLPKAMRADLLREAEEGGVTVWLAGHTHRTARRNHHRIAILNGETTGRNFDRHPAGFRLLTLYPGHRPFDWDFHALN